MYFKSETTNNRKWKGNKCCFRMVLPLSCVIFVIREMNEERILPRFASSSISSKLDKTPKKQRESHIEDS